MMKFNLELRLHTVFADNGCHRTAALFDRDVTALTILRDTCVFFSLTGSYQSIRDKSLRLAPTRRGISDGMLLLFALSYFLRFLEIYPWSPTYNFVTTVGFFVVYCVLTFLCYRYNYIMVSNPKEPLKRIIVGETPLGLNLCLTGAAIFARTYDPVGTSNPSGFFKAWGRHMETFGLCLQFYHLIRMIWRNEAKRLISMGTFMAIGFHVYSKLLELMNYGYFYARDLKRKNKVDSQTAFISAAIQITILVFYMVFVQPALKWYLQREDDEGEKGRHCCPGHCCHHEQDPHEDLKNEHEETTKNRHEEDVLSNCNNNEEVVENENELAENKKDK